jgi:3-phenylpropionate/trans-cinnamate dioxygenase ferredoxin subunit
MAFYRAGLVEEVPPGHTKYCLVAGKAVLIANVAGEIFALHGLCPHRLNPLDGAVLWGNLVDCPWHHFQYDVRTGENHFPKNVYPKDLSYLQEQVKPVKTYQVDVRGPEIWVDLE